MLPRPQGYFFYSDVYLMITMYIKKCLGSEVGKRVLSIEYYAKYEVIAELRISLFFRTKLYNLNWTYGSVIAILTCSAKEM